MAASGELIAILAIASLSVWAWLAGRRLSTAPGSSSQILFALSLMICMTFSWNFSGKLAWASVLPGSNVIFWANFVPILIAFVVGIATWTTGLQTGSRIATISILSCLGLAFLLVPIARPIVLPVQIADETTWDSDICLQSHESTCGAAAAATLLRLSGVHSNEQTMVAACLTSQYGTEPLGIYRGLAIGIRDANQNAKIASQNPDRWVQTNQLPCVALIRFDNHDALSTRWFLGPRSEGHAVVVLGQEGNHWRIADPAIGHVRWSDADFRRRFTGDAIYLGE